jgi:hypothetical protein
MTRRAVLNCSRAVEQRAQARDQLAAPRMVERKVVEDVDQRHRIPAGPATPHNRRDAGERPHPRGSLAIAHLRRGLCGLGEVFEVRVESGAHLRAQLGPVLGDGHGGVLSCSETYTQRLRLR